MYIYKATTRAINTPSSRIPNPSPRSRIAISQPGSRSTSPTPKYSYLTHNNNNNGGNSNAGSSNNLASNNFAYGNNEFNNYNNNACASSSPNAAANTNQFLNTSNSNYNDFTDFVADSNGKKLITNNKTPNWKNVTSKYSQSALNKSNASSAGDKPRMASSRNSSRDSSPGRSSGIPSCFQKS
jgi:hypothetical protein